MISQSIADGPSANRDLVEHGAVAKLVMQGPAKPPPAVRVRPAPPKQTRDQRTGKSLIPLFFGAEESLLKASRWQSITTQEDYQKSRSFLGYQYSSWNLEFL